MEKNKLFKPEVRFGSQIHVTIGMFTTAGYIYPYELIEENKRLKTDVSNKIERFQAIIWLNENVLINRKKTTLLISRLDLPPATLRIMGAAEVIKIHQMPPLFYRFKIKKGKIINPNHTQGIICSGLAQSAEGAKKIVGRKLESPYTRILDSFGTKGYVIVGIEKNREKIEVKAGDVVRLKELYHFNLKKI